MKAKILLLLISTLFSATLIELSSLYLLPQTPLREVFRVIELDAGTMWRNKPNLDLSFYNTTVTTNNLGLRYGLNTGNNQNILLNLGASPDFGWGVEYEQTYSAQIQHHFQESLKVINAGMIGHSSHQGRRIVEELLIRYRPKLVTIPYVINDLDRFRFYFNDGLADKSHSPSGQLKIALFNMAIKTHSYWLVQSLYEKVLLGSGLIDTSIKAKARVDLQDYIENMKSIAELVKAHDATPIFIIFPVKLPVSPECANSTIGRVTSRKCLAVTINNECQHYNNALADFARGLDLPVVDVRDALLGDQSKNFLVEQGDYIHPSGHGHRIMASLIINEITKRGLIEAK